MFQLISINLPFKTASASSGLQQQWDYDHQQVSLCSWHHGGLCWSKVLRPAWQCMLLLTATR